MSDEQVKRLEAERDGAYTERNRLVALIAAIYPAVRCRTAIEGWDSAWHGCVFIQLPTGQASWHYHDREAELFAHVPEGTETWDGHTTPEKYERIARLAEASSLSRRPRYVVTKGNREFLLCEWYPQTGQCTAIDGLDAMFAPELGVQFFDGWALGNAARARQPEKP